MDNLSSGTGCRTRSRALRRAAQCMAAALLCMLLLCACDPYDGYRPYDYGEAKWVCEEYDAWFLIDENLKMKFCGEIIVGGEKKNIAVRFLKADFVAIVPYEMVDGEVKLAYEDYLWHGDAKFSPTELVLHSPTVNYLFDEDDEEVVFVRQELDEAPAA
mgnify:FL=1